MPAPEQESEREVEFPVDQLTETDCPTVTPATERATDAVGFVPHWEPFHNWPLGQTHAEPFQLWPP